ncbi:MAG: glycosyltransferase family 2 protein [Anaerolineae bacterium]
MNVSIVIPAYNEEQSIGPLLKELHDCLSRDVPDLDYEVVVVDDGSQDKTGEVVSEIPGVRLIRHRINMGYGAALKSGIRGSSGEIIVTIDADGQHNPKDIGRLLQTIGGHDIVIGARTQHQNPLWRRPGKWLLGWLANYLAGEKIPDLNCGLRAVNREVVTKYLHLCPNRFSFSTTLTVALSCGGYRVGYVPIDVNRRSPRTRSTVNIRTGLETLLLMVRLIALFGPLKLFLPLSFVFILFGVVWGGHYVILGKGLSIAGLFFFLAGILLFFFGVLTDQIAALRKEKYE